MRSTKTKDGWVGPAKRLDIKESWDRTAAKFGVHFRASSPHAQITTCTPAACASTINCSNAANVTGSGSVLLRRS